MPDTFPPPRRAASLLQLATGVVFLALLCAPGLAHFWSGSASVLASEKRMATTWPGARAAGGSWKAYVTEAEAYLRDNFGFRGWLLSQYHWLRYSLLGDYHTGNAKVLIGREGWLFYDMHSQIDAGRGRWQLAPRYLQEWADAVAAEHRAARARNIPYLLVIAPNKNSVRAEMLPDWAQRGVHTSATDQILGHLRRTHPEIPFVDLRPAMRAIRHLPGVYLRTDVHWSHVAGWRGTSVILDAARQLHPGVARLPAESSYRLRPYISESGDLAARMSIRSRLKDLDFAVEPAAPPGFEELKQSPYLELPRLSPDHPTRVFRSTHAGAPRVAVFRDSFLNALLPFLPEGFRETVVFWRPFSEEHLDAVRPDMVIREMLEMRLYSPPGETSTTTLSSS